MFKKGDIVLYKVKHFIYILTVKSFTADFTYFYAEFNPGVQFPTKYARLASKIQILLYGDLYESRPRN